MKRPSISTPAVVRAVFYAVSLVLSLLVVFGVIGQEDADHVIDTLPGVLAAITTVIAPVMALLNIHRGSDSRVTEEDLRQVASAGQADPNAVAQAVAERLTDLWDTTGAHGAVRAATAALGASTAYPSNDGPAGTYPGGE